MPAYRKEDGGRAILNTLNAALEARRSTIASTVTAESHPVEYRRKVRNEAVTEAIRHVTDAHFAFTEWAREAEAGARTRAAATTTIGTSAEETRRLANEMRITRLVDAARIADERTGPMILARGEKPVANPTAYRYAAEAEAAWLDSRYDEAVILATASTTLGGPDNARVIGQSAQQQLDLADPAKASALREIADIEATRREFADAVEAAQVAVMEAAVDAARAINDDPSRYSKAATALSMSMKSRAMKAEGPYIEPKGALPSGPTGAPNRPTQDELNRATARVGS